MRVDRVQYGPLFLTNVPVVACPKEWIAFFEKRAGVPTAGLTRCERTDQLPHRPRLRALHRLLRDWPHFQFSRFRRHRLHPSSRRRRTIHDPRRRRFDGKPSVPEGENGVQAGDHLVAIDGIPVSGINLGTSVVSCWEATPGQERNLTVERGEKKLR